MDDVRYSYRRVCKRIPCSLIGSWKKGKKLPGLVRYSDLSRRGTGIFVCQRPTLNSQFDAEISTRGIGTINIAGKVCWVKKIKDGFRCGIFFNKELPYDLNKIVN